MGFEMTVLAEAGLDTQAGLGYTGTAEKYISAVQRFYNNYEKNSKAVYEYFLSGDYENYMITVHALKSNAKMLGASELSGYFEALENAAREGNTDYISDHTADVMTAYENLVERLKPVGEMTQVHAADEISAEEARSVADKLLEALDDFDDDLSKELAAKLSGYPFRLTQKELLKKAAGFIDDFMYDEAADIIKEIVPARE